MRQDEQHSDSERVESILAGLQEEIDRHRLALGQLGALEPPDPLAQVRQHKWVNSHLPIGWPALPPGLIPKIAAMVQKVVRRLLRWYINPIVDQQNRFNEAAFERLAAHQANMDEVAGELHAVANDVKRRGQLQDGLLQELRALESQVARLQAAAEAHEQIIHDERTRRLHDQEVNRFRLQRLENKGQTPARDAVPPSATQPPPIDYYLLGITHRSETQLAERLADYDDLFTTALPGPVLDLGCGRGDLVEHLAHLGLEASGIDLDADAVRIGQEMGRRIELADIFGHLDTVASGSLGAVCLIQVAEHLEIPALQTLFARLLDRLAPGGMVIVETINPTCLTALTNAFLLDPSHQWPLHPLMTQFLLEQSGFAEVQIRYLHPVDDAQKLASVQGLPDPLGHLAQTNIDRLNALLYGAQDYAAIAIKRGEN